MWFVYQYDHLSSSLLLLQVSFVHWNLLKRVSLHSAISLPNLNRFDWIRLNQQKIVSLSCTRILHNSWLRRRYRNWTHIVNCAGKRLCDEQKGCGDASGGRDGGSSSAVSFSDKREKSNATKSSKLVVCTLSSLLRVDIRIKSFYIVFFSLHELMNKPFPQKRRIGLSWSTPVLAYSNFFNLYIRFCKQNETNMNTPELLFFFIVITIISGGLTKNTRVIYNNT